MAGYLTVAEFAVRSVMPSEDVRALVTAEPGFVEALLEDLSDEIDTPLRKRYRAPFEAPVPRIVKRWLTRMATLECYEKRGFDPESKEGQLIVNADAAARADIQKAADSNQGLFELPLRADGTDTSGIVKGAPLGYSEPSPYTWLDRQREAVRNGCR